MPEEILRSMVDGRPVWLVDGVAVPVVSGADDDEGDEGVGAAGFAAALDSELGDAGDDGSTDDGEAGDDAGAPPDGGAPAGRSWEDYARQMRHENAQYRQRFQPYEQAFSRLPDETAKALLHVANRYAEDPEQAMFELLDALGLEAPDGGGQPQYLTRDDFRDEMQEVLRQQKLAEEQQAQVEAGREEIRRVAKDAGFEPGTKAYNRLLHIARDEFSEDEFGGPRPVAEAVRLAAAALVDELSEYEKNVLSRYLEGKGKGGGVGVTGAGEAASNEQPITDLDTAARAFKEFITQG